MFSTFGEDVEKSNAISHVMFTVYATKKKKVVRHFPNFLGP